MKVYIVMEGEGIICPQDPAELFYGVFSSREAATECMECHCRYMSSFGWCARIGEDGKAIDQHGNVYFQIVEWDLDACRTETWI